MSSSDIFLALIAVLFPPIAVWIKRGVCTTDSLLNLLLCIFGYIPGLLHAWYIIARYPDAEYAPLGQNDPEDRIVTYYYVSSDGQRMNDGRQGPRRQEEGHKMMGPQGDRGTGGYGTNDAAAAAGSAGGSSQAQVQPQGQAQGQEHGAGPSASQGEDGQGAVPPSYDDAVKGDHKVQT